MSKKMLLIESISVDPGQIKKAGGRYLVEQVGGKLIVTLPATTLDKPNLNERIYSTSLMEGVIRKTKSAFEARELLSSVNEHPSEPYVTPGQASHVVIDAWTEAGVMYNKWEVLETATGKDLRALIESGVSFGVSIRGVGSMDNYGNILEDYEFLGCDCVGEPSAQLRVRPEVVAESNVALERTLNARGKLTKDTKMADKNAVLTHIKEQRVLIENEMKSGDKIVAFQRAAAVETYLSECQVPGKELAEIYGAWEAVKKECFNGSALAEAVAPPAGDADLEALHKKVLERRSAQIGVMARGLNQLAEQLKAVKVAAVKRVEDASKKADFRVRVAEAKLTKAASQATKSAKMIESLKQGNDSLLAEAATREMAYRMAVKEAARINLGYKFAIKEAARLIKAGKGLIRESVWTFFTDADYQMYAGAGRPFDKMEPMISEGTNYQAALAGTDGGQTQIQVFAEDGVVSYKDVKDFPEAYAIMQAIPETVTTDWLKEYGFAGLNESKGSPFKKAVSLNESKGRIDNTSHDGLKTAPKAEQHHNEHKMPGWI